jgi:integrase
LHVESFTAFATPCYSIESVNAADRCGFHDGASMRGHLRKRGNAWELRAFAGHDPVTGRKIYRTRTFHGGKREAENALSRLVQEVSGGNRAAREATVCVLLREWLELAKADLSPSTVRGYQNCIKRYIQPMIGDVRLEGLHVAQLDRLYALLRTDGGPTGRPLATATIRQVHAVLRRALQQGVKWGWIDSNPASLASPPRVRNKPVEPPDPTVVSRLIADAGDDNPDLAAFLQLAATTGARRGELCGLHWDAVDFEQGTMTIARSIVEDSEGRQVEKDTKTHSVRRIALDRTSLDVLRIHRERCEGRAMACSVLLSNGSYVFQERRTHRRHGHPTTSRTNSSC